MYERLYEGRVEGGICICGYTRLLPSGKVEIRRPSKAGHFDSLTAIEECVKNECNNSDEWGNCIESTIWNKLYHWSLFQHVKFLEGRTNEDVSIALDILHYSKGINAVEGYGYWYLRREGSISNRRNFVRHDYLEARKLMETQVKKYAPSCLPYAQRLVVDASFGLMRDVALLPAEKRSSYREVKKECLDAIAERRREGYKLTMKQEVKLYLLRHMPTAFRGLARLRSVL